MRRQALVLVFLRRPDCWAGVMLASNDRMRRRARLQHRPRTRERYRLHLAKPIPATTKITTTTPMRIGIGNETPCWFASATEWPEATAEDGTCLRLPDQPRAGSSTPLLATRCGVAVDRLGRSLMDVLTTVTKLVERGIGVRSVSDGIDPATSTGRLMLNLMATLAEYERELIVEHVNAGIAVARAAGTRFGRPP